MDRRAFVGTGIALATATAVGAFGAVAKTPGHIDVHHHVFPPRLRQALSERWPGMLLPDEQASLRQMNESNTVRSIISFPNSEITVFPEQDLTELIRASNDYAIDLVGRYPKRYGLFASLPMPYIDASLRELERVAAIGAVEGILLISNYGERWLGDPQFAPVLEQIDRRGMILYVHPNAANCCRGLLPGVSDSIVEFQTDTSRTIASLLFSGTADRLRGIRFLFSHSGGTVPALIERFTTASRATPSLAEKIPQGALWYLRRFHFDTAQTANTGALGALLSLVPDTQVLFGSDFPYRSAAEQVLQLQSMRLGHRTLDRILSTNALRLLAAHSK